jgi:hypothetical protein
MKENHEPIRNNDEMDVKLIVYLAGLQAKVNPPWERTPTIPSLPASQAGPSRHWRDRRGLADAVYFG